MKDLIPEDAAIEILASGFEWSEGPAWWPEKQSLLFSDIPRNTVFLWNEAGGVVPVPEAERLHRATAEFLGVEPGSNGLVFDAQGRLVLCQHGDRRVARLKADGKSFETLVDAYEGKRLNSPNDLVFASDGALYFTDPPYGLPKNVDDPAKELPFQGVYRLTPDGELTLLTDEMSRPNGIGLSPDEKTLYVANSDTERPIWMAFPIKEDGTLGEGRVFADARDQVGKAPGSLPDGMAVDADGQPLRHRPRRRLGLRPRRHPPRDPRHRRGHRQLHLRRPRRLDPLHHRRHVPLPDRHEDQGDQRRRLSPGPGAGPRRSAATTATVAARSISRRRPPGAELEDDAPEDPGLIEGEVLPPERERAAGVAAVVAAEGQVVGAEHVDVPEHRHLAACQVLRQLPVEVIERLVEPRLELRRRHEDVPVRRVVGRPEQGGEVEAPLGVDDLEDGRDLADQGLSRSLSNARDAAIIASACSRLTAPIGLYRLSGFHRMTTAQWVPYAGDLTLSSSPVNASRVLRSWTFKLW